MNTIRNLNSIIKLNGNFFSLDRVYYLSKSSNIISENIFVEDIIEDMNGVQILDMSGDIILNV